LKSGGGAPKFIAKRVGGNYSEEQGEGGGTVDKERAGEGMLKRG